MSPFQPFRAPYAPPDEKIARKLLANAADNAEAEARISATATRLIEAVRAKSGGLGGIEDFLREYSLSTKEGLALMVLAEALLRVPDAATSDALIEDKLAAGDWTNRETRSDALLVSASAWALGITARIVQPGETPDTILEQVTKRLGMPAVRAATKRAMRLLGSHFVMGETIEAALRRTEPEYRYSFDMLGEGARTAADAERYYASYADAIEKIGRSAKGTLPALPGISVKLSALHPRYEAVSRERVMIELVPKIVKLAERAKAHQLNFTIDAEEADRLELSLDVIAAVAASPTLAEWDGFGLAVQAYQKRAPEVVRWIIGLAQGLGRRFMVRLVKGAYWDSEIKRAQERGLADFPVFSRKPMTDLCYEACARELLAARPHIFPQFATHNALTVAEVLEHAGNREGFEFQRLHGMGEALYDALLGGDPQLACRVYAPVGGHRDLLAYLVRRLLENGANSSFVSAVTDPNVPVAELIERPEQALKSGIRHPHIRLSADIYAPQRRNSAGVEFGDAAALAALTEKSAATPNRRWAAGETRTPRKIRSPIDGAVIGEVREASPADCTAAIDRAARAFPAWNARTIDARAAMLERTADAIEASRDLLVLLQLEGGKTLDDAVAEIREAVDFCRYYAAEARTSLTPQTLPGPTGETNVLRHRGRGVFLCISPWNFPLAIFLGQVSAALVAGNTVIAKPAEQTPLIAAEALRLLHAAGVPADVVQLVAGDGAVGASLVADRRVAGVAFTGSTEIAWKINRTLAAKNGPIVPLIAETGGINAMIVDSTALPEQVTDDVVTSAFRSAGQRCSALRLLCLQADIADHMLTMIEGATAELKLGDPRDASTHIGPVIDADARDHLARKIAAGRLRFRHPGKGVAGGTYVAPAILEIDTASDLTEEVFGPVLHVVRYRAGDLPRVIDAIAATGYGLTLGVHSRIAATAEKIAARLPHGNVYVNRNMIGAVVGTQPFGGSGLSGTGPKAGGPAYLHRFALEQTVTTNTTAAGGNASLLAEADE
ncbi:bifunctional protein PutA [Variibacter gotjawalensis]|uniref:Bifunctional protein PutA n=1 Tax=Variibacter gotjawalensis TaxID=1333996 RepID=A0A0S3Q0N0_9BRAD|nr:bifunctional proline dehydrogenase/L-glutamate gamma-semialdehyde dehydrogenase PutA [Variibacter gotjawalensis]NIK47578.1 RHH-type proline utilization regulon transcriptional repressor/proline dehydrogenase/delta 1-pyrroline-5-carboxylate dehydrogenase [Variibacter gotjawalensis]RZS49475.1 L-proline dehydrogenase /delta-1-pyrroline-5-carboxylate dehydrogenase [Variibacter gotjawalensis]BAT61738.1 bifunctional protein PutA [Variibacter gotjawalensis]